MDTSEEARETDSRPTPSQLSGATIRFGVITALTVVALIGGWPQSALPRLVFWIGITVALSVTGIELAVRSGRTQHTNLADQPPRRLLAGWVEQNYAFEDDFDRLELFRQVFSDGREARSRISRFVILMAFASVIAAVGVIADSTAIVIGAMLIAPLITPMMGMALGLALGWPSRLLRASMLVGAGVLIAVGVGWLMPSLLLSSIDVTTNTQIVSRTSPTLVDLVVAIAAGAAGSFALARPDVSSSLPGVAIAIALVPPLSVVGILLHAGERSLATGAALLFLTNLVAILMTGGLVFGATGVAPLARLNDSQHRIRVALGAVAILAIAVVGSLAANGAEITGDSLDRDTARSATLDWLDGSEFGLISIDLTDDTATIVIAGPGTPPPAASLGDRLSSALSRPIDLNLQWIPRSQEIILAAD